MNGCEPVQQWKVAAVHNRARPEGSLMSALGTHPAFVATVPVLFLAATAAALYTFFFASFLEVLFTSFLAVEMFCKIQQLHLTMIFSIAKIIHLVILRIIIFFNFKLLMHDKDKHALLNHRVITILLAFAGSLLFSRSIPNVVFRTSSTAGTRCTITACQKMAVVL